MHGFWDVQFVDGIAKPPSALAKQLLSEITPADAATWAQGKSDEWAMEALMISKSDAYGNPPLSKDSPQHISSTYVAKAEQDVTLQLKRAGIRLAFVLNQKLGTEAADWASCLKSSPAATIGSRSKRSSR